MTLPSTAPVPTADDHRMTDIAYLLTALSSEGLPEGDPTGMTQQTVDMLFDSVREQTRDWDTVDDDPDATVPLATVTTVSGGPFRWHGACIPERQAHVMFTAAITRGIESLAR